MVQVPKSTGKNGIQVKLRHATVPLKRMCKCNIGKSQSNAKAKIQSLIIDIVIAEMYSEAPSNCYLKEKTDVGRTGSSSKTKVTKLSNLF